MGDKGQNGLHGGDSLKLKLSCADFTFPLLPHDKTLKLIAMLGFKGVDVGLFEGRSHLQPSREFCDVRRSAKLLKRRLDDQGLAPADIFLQSDANLMTCAINHPVARRRRKARDCFLKALEYAATCECKHITSVPLMHFDKESYADSFNRCVDELAWRVNQAELCRLTFAVEPHVGGIISTPGRTEKLLRRVPGLTLTLDYGHFTLKGLSDSAVQPLIKYASHFHARGARKGRLQESLKRNTIDYKRILETMRDTGYRGWLCIEYVRMDWGHCDESDNLSETILFRDHLLSLVVAKIKD